jgi:hypothetical protein
VPEVAAEVPAVPFEPEAPEVRDTPEVPFVAAEVPDEPF